MMPGGGETGNQREVKDRVPFGHPVASATPCAAYPLPRCPAWPGSAPRSPSCAGTSSPGLGEMPNSGPSDRYVGFATDRSLAVTTTSISASVGVPPHVAGMRAAPNHAGVVHPPLRVTASKERHDVSPPKDRLHHRRRVSHVMG